MKKKNHGQNIHISCFKDDIGPKNDMLWHLHYSKMSPKPPKCTLVLRSRPKSAFKVKQILNMRLWGHVGRIRREKLVCAIFWKCIFIDSVMRTRQNITSGMAFSKKLTCSTLGPKFECCNKMTITRRSEHLFQFWIRIPKALDETRRLVMVSGHFERSTKIKQIWLCS